MHAAPVILPSSFHPGCREIIFTPVTAPSLPHLLPLASTLFFYRFKSIEQTVNGERLLTHDRNLSETLHMTKCAVSSLVALNEKIYLSSSLSPAVCSFSFASHWAPCNHLLKSTDTENIFLFLNFILSHLVHELSHSFNRFPQSPVSVRRGRPQRRQSSLHYCPGNNKLLLCLEHALLMASRSSLLAGKLQTLFPST